MPQIGNFDEARAVLRQFYNRPGSNSYTLDRMQALMKFLGNPQNELKAVHIAGTSGKTSTAYYAAALLEQAGFKVGLTVSPHVIEMNERLQINRVPLAEDDFCTALSGFLDRIKVSGIEPSYFELMVAFAFQEFHKRGVDFAVVEVGLGGLLDATNVISRDDKVCVITDIGLDHVNVLGKTLREIAAQKAGIIQPGNHVFMYGQAAEIMDEVRAVRRSRKAELHEITDAKVRPLQLAELPLFQQRNFYLARHMIEFILERDERRALTSQQISQATQSKIPDRMEIHRIKGKTIVFDGAHNEQKMAALVASMRAAFPGQKIAAMIAFAATKDNRWQTAIDELADYIDAIIATTPQADESTMPKSFVQPEQIKAYFESLGKDCEIGPDLSAACAKFIGGPEPVLLVTGSLYLYSKVRPFVGS